MAVKKKSHENLSDENIAKVIDLLAAEKPITKKEACGILNISYNTTRLTKIIDVHVADIAYRSALLAKNRGKPASNLEIKEIITEYLQGISVAQIAAGVFRSTGFVKAVIENVGVPKRGANAEEKSHVNLIPEQCIAESFEIGELVWSARYHTIACIRSEITPDYTKRMKGIAETDYATKYLGKVYTVYVTEEVTGENSLFPAVTSGGFFASVAAYDLGSLQHLTTYGVELQKI